MENAAHTLSGLVLARAGGGLRAIRNTRAYATWLDFARHRFAGRVDGGWILGDARHAPTLTETWCNLRVTDR